MKKFIGQVISNKMVKTAVVEVKRQKIHPLYRKRLTIKKKYHVHDEIGVKVGDWVKFVETRPISKLKHFVVVSTPSK